MSAEDGRMALARRAAATLYTLGARRVWAFGSLARGGDQDRKSDVDVAVEGMTEAETDAAAASISAALGCHVDVMAMEIASPQMRASITRNRVLLPRSAREAPVGGEVATLPGWFARTTQDVKRQLFHQRLAAIQSALREAGARSVLDLGCGKGWLIELLARDPQFTRIVGVDLDDAGLAEAERRLGGLPPEHRRKVTLLHDVITRQDPRYLGFDAVVASEVIEHLDPPRLRAFEKVVFEFIRPKTVIITTPNADYNARWGMKPGEMRHPDHRFEWGREEFERWVAGLSGIRLPTMGVIPEDSGPTLLWRHDNQERRG